MQLHLGVELSPGELVGKVATWIIMGGIAVWLSVAFLGCLSRSESLSK
jgi:hypothetical protein